MKKWERNLVPGGFTLAGLLFLFAAMKRFLTGQALNAAFLAIGLALLVFGIVLWVRLGRAGRVEP